MGEAVHIQRIPTDDLQRIREVDRTELIAAKYEVVRSADGLSLSLVERACDPPEEFPNWDEEGRVGRREWWQRELAGGGAAFGAFLGERLVGFAVTVTPRRAAEVLGIFVDAGFRRGGIGGRLLAAAEEYAKDAGAPVVYLHPNLTVAAVGFYRKHGYALTCLVEEGTLSCPEMETCIVLAKRVGG